VSPDSFAGAAAVLVFQAHKQARQLHALISGDAAPSGESRKQAAADFAASLGPTSRAVERAVRWLLETAYAYAVYLTGGAVGDVRATVTCNLSAAVPTSEEIKEVREGVGAGLLKRARYQALQGVDDSEAEDEAIDKEDVTNGRDPSPIPAATDPGSGGAAEPGAAVQVDGGRGPVAVDGER
jgi:hypothetical protein